MKYLFFALTFLIVSPYKCNNPSRKAYPVFGIDISHHQGRVKWDAVKQSGVQFVFMKSTEGGDYIDSMYKFNWALCKTLKIKRGAYHYFTFCRSGKQQAEHFISQVSLQTGDLPPVVDLEFGGNCKRNVFNREQLYIEIQAFITELENHYCEPVIIYTTPEFYRDYISGNFPGNPIWIRDVLNKPHLPDNRKWTFWQYRIDTLSGIKGEVDMNVFNGNPEDLERICVDTVCAKEVKPLYTQPAM